jgi:NAD(P)-dependent dehydrogenase (short-subunit alcohol dehydrogenase family)
MNHNSILITGINRGLGLSLSRIFLSQGHALFAIIRHTSAALQSLQKQYGDQLKLYTGDVTDEPSIMNAVGDISRDTDHIDMLINNSAIIFPADKIPIEHVDFSVYEKTFQVNSIGPLKVIKHALPLVRKGTKKLIINISSEAGSIGDAWRTSEYAYCMSKSALNMASRILQNYVADEGIRVLAVHPGWFSSDMGTAAAPITPDQAAEKVTVLFERSFELKGPMYFDLHGNMMPW